MQYINSITQCTISANCILTQYTCIIIKYACKHHIYYATWIKFFVKIGRLAVILGGAWRGRSDQPHTYISWSQTIIIIDTRQVSMTIQSSDIRTLSLAIWHQLPLCGCRMVWLCTYLYQIENGFCRCTYITGTTSIHHNPGLNAANYIGTTALFHLNVMREGQIVAKN